MSKAAPSGQQDADADADAEAGAGAGVSGQETAGADDRQSPVLTVNAVKDEEQPTAADVDAAEAANAGNKEQLVRKLRRVASAPIVQAPLFNDDDDDDDDDEGDDVGGSAGAGATRQRRTGCKTDVLPQGPFSVATTPAFDPENRIARHVKNSPNEAISNTYPPTAVHSLSGNDNDENTPPPPLKMEKSRGSSTGGRLRRLYGNSSTKVRNVEVGPGDFDKIKLIGKGDVGKVYLVREHKSDRLYAMKGLPTLSIN